MTTYSSGLVEVQEQILIRDTYSMTFPANTASMVEAVPHTLRVAPLIDYKISVDGGVTYFKPSAYREVGVTVTYISLYADESNFYFSAFNNGSNPPVNSEYAIVFLYNAYVTEVVRS